VGGRQRGELTPLAERVTLVELIKEATDNGARLDMACEVAVLSKRTYRRWYSDGKMRSDKRTSVVRPHPKNKLTELERQMILATCNEFRFASLPPSQIVPTLLDEGVYIASESSYYRVLKANDQLNRRGRSREHVTRSKPDAFEAKGPNEVWSWDITYCPSIIKGQFYYLYMFVDIYSRKIVGYEVHEQECGELAAQLMQRNMLREQCFNKPIVLHSDNGAPMKCFTMKAKLDELGVTASLSRPSVSNDNPFSESLFRTLKYRPQWPTKGFNSLTETREWVDAFVTWYNDEHKHSKLNFVSPGKRHAMKDQEILSNRKAVIETAREANPIRWANGIRNCTAIGSVMLNPDNVPDKMEKEVA
jgi:putative transposase